MLAIPREAWDWQNTPEEWLFGIGRTRAPEVPWLFIEKIKRK